MHYLYVLYSETTNTFYVGESYDLNKRVIKHNHHAYKGSFTKIASDWKIVLSKQLTSKEEALYLEKFIKKMKSKKFISKIIQHPDILDDILSKK